MGSVINQRKGISISELQKVLSSNQYSISIQIIIHKKRAQSKLTWPLMDLLDGHTDYTNAQVYQKKTFSSTNITKVVNLLYLPLHPLTPSVSHNIITQVTETDPRESLSPLLLSMEYQIRRNRSHSPLLLCSICHLTWQLVQWATRPLKYFLLSFANQLHGPHEAQRHEPQPNNHMHDWIERQPSRVSQLHEGRTYTR